jgi:hypothetical protein
MTYRDSDALFLPARPPQHAAPVSFLRRRGSPGQLGVFGRLRRLTRQVLQLFITFVAWAAGLGLVIGSIVLVATVTAPTQPPPSLKMLPAGSSLHRVQYGTRPPSGAASKGPRYQLLAAFSGHGNRRTAHFNVKAKLQWQLRWTYTCARQADAGQFKVLRADWAAGHSTRSTGVEEHAASGHGFAWFKPSTLKHYLVVISACSWHIKVEQAAGPRPG